MDPNRFADFLRVRRGDLSRIARQSRERLLLDELASEAWILAERLGRGRGLELDFADAADQEQLLGGLYARHVKAVGSSVRYASSIDASTADAAGERAGSAIANLLLAPMESDPQVQRMLRDEQEEFLGVVRRSYSQAAAYVLLLIRVEWQLGDLARLLSISVHCLRQRMARCAGRVRMQPGLFDGVVVIPLDFQPFARPRMQAPRDPGPAPRQRGLWQAALHIT